MKIIIDVLVFVFTNKHFRFPGRKQLNRVIRKIIRQPVFTNIWCGFISAKLLKENTQMTNKTIRVLALNYRRYIKDDVEVVMSESEVEFISMPIFYQQLINSLFIGDVDIKKMQENNPSDLKLKNKQLCVFLQSLIPRLMRKNKLDCILTCSFYYFHDQAWIGAAHHKNIPFLIWHKEGTKYTKANMELMAKMYVKRMSWIGKNPIPGDIIVRDYQERDTILMAGLCKEKNIHVIGTMRYDRIYRLDKSNKIKKPRRQVTLFSPMLLLPGMDALPQNIKKITLNPEEGIVEYFYKVHGAIAELASQNPETDFIIKPKWEKDWVKLIEESIWKESGLKVASIPNLVITTEFSAQQLIENSKVVIGVSSTTLLEAKLFKRHTIIPYFSEVSQEYRDFVMFYDDFDQEFIVARSKNELKSTVMKHVNMKNLSSPMHVDRINHYLAYYDGKTIDRFSSIMKNEINSVAF